ncbi:MAG: TonB-dependent receptor [Bryobacterales bacterium]|nr:TonB-dependent receptor [Bryobacterales bacterium]
MRGTVSDTTGAVIPGVTVTLVSQETNVGRTVSTNDNGDFEIPLLGPGVYRLTVESPGFRTYIADDVEITARQIRRLDVSLEVGDVATEVTVTAGAAVITTEGSQVSDGFNDEKFVDSPLSYSFFPQAHMTTSPAVQTNAGGWGIRIAGQAPEQAQQQMDGVANDGVLNLVNNMNDFEEMQVITSGQSAEFSRPVGLTMTGKSGTNQIHGRIYYDITNSALNARNTFQQTKVPFKQHRGGANVSGPIIKDKTFFFFGYSFTRIPSGQFYTANTAPAAYRTGDFSSLSTAVKDPATGNPFPNNMVPSSRFSSVSTAVQSKYIPLPNRGSAATTANNYQFVHPYPDDILKWDGITPRIDHHFSSKNTFYARFINRVTPYILSRNFDWSVWTRKRNHFNIVVADTHVFSPNLINEFRFGWIKDYFIDGDEVDGVLPQRGDAVVQEIGLQGVNPQGFSAMGFPRMDITGLTSLSTQPGGVALDEKNFQFSNSVTWNTGKHTIKFGPQLRTFRSFNSVVKEGNYGYFNFDGRITGVPYADFLLGIPGRSRRLDPFVGRTLNAYELGIFFTDTFKVTSKLTLDYGLRWDYFKPATYQDNLQYNWDPSTGNVIVSPEGMAALSPLYPSTINVVEGKVVPDADKGNFQPRFGAAYRFGQDFVVRGGYGTYSEYLGRFSRYNTGGPFEITEDYLNQVVNGAPLFAFPNPFPGLDSAQIPSQSISSYPNQTNNGIIHQFNVSLEKQVGQIGLRTSYLGSRNRGMNYSLNTNKPEASLIPFTVDRRPYSQFVNTTEFRSDGKDNYDAWQVQVMRRTGSLQFDGHYTLSNSTTNYANLQDPYANLDTLWNRQQYNSRHRAVINATYSIPYGRGKKYGGNLNRAVDAAIGGWQLGWISYFQTGQYFSPTFSGSDPSNTSTFGGTPDRIGDGNYDRGNRSITDWFDASAFAVPAAGRYGNSGLNTLIGPGWNLHHFTLLKRFPITERVAFNLQGMFQNVFNTPHYNFPGANISQASQVGIITSTRNSREKDGNREIIIRGRIEF